MDSTKKNLDEAFARAQLESIEEAEIDRLLAEIHDHPENGWSPPKTNSHSRKLSTQLKMKALNSSSPVPVPKKKPKLSRHITMDNPDISPKNRLNLDARSRNFCGTHMDAGDFEGEYLELSNKFEAWIIGGIAKYGVIGKETCPTTGRKHLQYFVSFSNPKTLRAAIRCFLKGDHIEVAIATASINRTYCMKEGDATEFGTFQWSINLYEDMLKYNLKFNTIVL